MATFCYGSEKSTKSSLSQDEIRYILGIGKAKEDSQQHETLTVESTKVDFKDMIRKYHTPESVERAKVLIDDKLSGLMSKKDVVGLSPVQFFLACLERLSIITTRYYDIVKLIEVIGRNHYDKLLAALSATYTCHRDFAITCGLK